MKLDFSALAQPAAKARGQVGTTGTPTLTLVCASPPAQLGAGTTGHKLAAVALAADLLVAAPAACPPVSPACPQVADDEKPNAGAASPVSPLVPGENEEADRCHAPYWDDAEIVSFTARTDRFARLGRSDANDLAQRLMLRDRDGDDRRLCLECTWPGDTGRCLAAATGRIPGADRRLEPVQTILQRCGAFGLRKCRV